jgi:peptidyl-prolyl cis-trans isomerase D
VDAARAKAQDILKQVKAGGDFAALAKKNSQDPGSAEKGGELGWVVKDQTVAEFEKVAFSQAKGQISDLVQTSFGFHIIQTEEKEDAHLQPLAEVKADIEKIIKAQKGSELREKISAEAADMAQKEGLDKAAAKFKAQVVPSNMVGRNDTLPGVGPSTALMEAVFATAEKSGPQTGRAAQAYVFFEVTKIEPARTPSFDEIKDKVAGDFKNVRAGEMLRRNVQAMVDRARNEHDLAKAAKEAGATFKTSELVDRTAQTVPDIGSMSGPASAAFSMKSGEISGPVSLGNKQAVLEVIDRQEPSLTDPEFIKQRDGLREQLAEQKQQEALGLYMTSLGERLKKEGKVKINAAEMPSPAKPRS